MGEESSRFTNEELQRAILKGLTGGGMSGQLGRGPLGIVKEVRERLFPEQPPDGGEITQAVWALVVRELAFLDFSHRGSDIGPASPENWWFTATAAGYAAANETLAHPDMPEDYLNRFVRNVPEAGPIVRNYLEEALRTYTSRCYIASAVMLGVAAEAAFLEVTKSMCKRLTPEEAKKLKGWIEGTWRPYEKIREEFMRRLDPYRANMPDLIKQNLDIQITAIFELIRRYRNDSGHPTGFTVDRGACFLSLVAFAEAVRRLYALKGHLDGMAAP